MLLSAGKAICIAETSLRAWQRRSSNIAIVRAATSEKFRGGGKVTFGNDYDVIDVQSTVMRLFCYDQLAKIGGGNFFILGGHGRPQGGIGISSPW